MTTTAGDGLENGPLPLSPLRRVRARRVLRALSAAIAHEVSQPLTGMLANAGAGLRWLDRDAPDIAEARAALERIVADGLRAGEILDSLRGMFAPETRERAAVDVNAVLRQVLAEAEAALHGGRIAVRPSFDDAIPEIVGDPVLLRQAAANLVGNAIEAMAAVDDRPRVLRVETDRLDATTVLVTVADSGPGVAADRRDWVFEPFHSTKPRGMGFGLTFCRAIVEAHGGRLWIADNPPRGATFRFTLPRDGGAWTETAG